jgi:hypothetical protein
MLNTCWPKKSIIRQTNFVEMILEFQKKIIRKGALGKVIMLVLLIIGLHSKGLEGNVRDMIIEKKKTLIDF